MLLIYYYSVFFFLNISPSIVQTTQCLLNIDAKDLITLLGIFEIPNTVDAYMVIFERLTRRYYGVSNDENKKKFLESVQRTELPTDLRSWAVLLSDIAEEQKAIDDLLEYLAMKKVPTKQFRWDNAAQEYIKKLENYDLESALKAKKISEKELKTPDDYINAFRDMAALHKFVPKTPHAALLKMLGLEKEPGNWMEGFYQLAYFIKDLRYFVAVIELVHEVREFMEVAEQQAYLMFPYMVYNDNELTIIIGRLEQAEIEYGVEADFLTSRDLSNLLNKKVDEIFKFGKFASTIRTPAYFIKGSSTLDNKASIDQVQSITTAISTSDKTSYVTTKSRTKQTTSTLHPSDDLLKHLINNLKSNDESGLIDYQKWYTYHYTRCRIVLLAEPRPSIKLLKKHLQTEKISYQQFCRQWPTFYSVLSLNVRSLLNPLKIKATFEEKLVVLQTVTNYDTKIIELMYKSMQKDLA